jgi:2-polyprenyl-3-methyl-5-hydroxy-6-metoxy-1,4-benzoquinol methylase
MTNLQKYDILDPNLFIKYEHHMTNSLIINAVVARINKPNQKICDVGGASGIILDSIIKKSKYKINAYILDLFKKYKKELVNRNIHFILGSIIDNKLKSNQYDFVILRDVLHHLITGGG